MALAYYMFVNHGTLPHIIAELPVREKSLIFVMAKKVIEDRKKALKS